ncbi:protein SMAX1-LIKE 8 isoform X1 [Arachis hypogaea]|uniref:protein SMAX1-LIKE 8 isoform X1 n=1 Tax=Arachis hypogaea TaxID=3818 RepID=UPI000DEDCC04|nr:protein SMAX1-LIKE 7 isoform X1 [Arachis hypogaea]
MPTPVAAARQCLTPEAARALDEAVSVARRRGHAQTTSLHAISALLSLPSSSLLRDACCRARNSAYSPRLQFKALDLCLSVSLDRSPSSNPSTDPPVSNSLMAAIKRSQANQRRHPDTFHNQLLFQSNHSNNLQQTQQPFSVSSVKVELQHLVISILDDPVVSRVFAEAGFRSSEIKLAILRPLPQLFRYSRSRGPPVFLCNLPEQGRRGGFFGFPFSGRGDGGEEESFRRIGEVLVRSKGRNPVLLGACAGEAMRQFVEAVEKRREGVLPVELVGLRIVSGIREAEEVAEKGVGPGVVVNLGDLKGFVAEEENNGGEEGVLGELGRLLKVHSERVWLIGFAGSYESYLKFVGRFPFVEKDWDLQLLPITSLQSCQRPRSSLMDSFVPFGGFFSSPSDLKSPLPGCIPNLRHRQNSERCEQEVPAPKERFSSLAVEPCQSNYQPWLQIAEINAAKGLNTKTKKDDFLLFDGGKSMPTHKNMDNVYYHLRQGFSEANSCPNVMGFLCTKDKKKDAENRDSKVTDNSPVEVIDLNSEVPANLQILSTSLPTSSFSLAFKEMQGKHTSKPMFQKAEDLDSADLRSCNISNSSVCDGSEMSPTSVNSVTTDLGLGLCSSPTSNKFKKPIDEYSMGPPKQIGSQFSSNFNLADGNILKHMSQSSSCLSFDHVRQVDARNPKSLFEVLSKEVTWQDEALHAIVKAIVCSSTKRIRQCGAIQRGDLWMNFVGPDRHGKKKVAVALAEILYGSRDSFICMDLGSKEMRACNAVKFRGKTTLDFIVGEFCKKTLSVVFLENVDKADGVTQSSLLQAIRTGKITDSHGREIGLNNATFVTSFLNYKDSLTLTEEPSNYPEERILMAKRGAIKIKVEHAIGDIISNRLRDVMPNLIFVNKRKLIGDNEFHHDRHLISDVPKRAHIASNWLLDLNLPAEESESQQMDIENSKHVSTGNNQNIWLQDLCDQAYQTVVFKPFDFDALEDRVLKVIRSNFNKILGSECVLQIQSEVIDQLLAAAYVLDQDTVVKWVEQVLSEGFLEVQRRCNPTASSIVKLASYQDQALSVYLPPTILLD